MYPLLKRCIDVIIAGLGIIILFPLLVVVAIAIWIRMGRPILFKQMRPGMNGQAFYMYKFCTMTNERNQEGQLLPDEIRLTDRKSVV